MLTLAVALACLALPAAAENNTGEQILREDGAPVLSVVKDGAETRTLPLQDGENLSVLLDTEDELFLSCDVYDRHITYDFHYADGAWRLSAVQETHVREKEWRDPVETVIQEAWAALDGDVLRREVALSDENDNLLYSAELPPLPNVLTADQLLLERFSLDHPPFTADGYAFDRETDSAGCEAILAAEFACLGSGYQLLSATEYAEMQFVAQRPDGARVLLCGEYDGAAWRYVESAPLPEQAQLQPWWPMLALTGAQTGVTVARDAQGRWGVDHLAIEDGLTVGPICVAVMGEYGRPLALGASPWQDITALDWEALPRTLAEATAALDTDGWATPNNPDPADRLHLREQPDKGSRSLGKYYNGAPVQVLERGDDWTRVRVGGVEGYMMTRYLAFGADMQSVRSACLYRLAAHPLTPVLRADGQTELLPLDVVYVIGLRGDTEYILWDFHTDTFYTVPMDAVWEGNG